MKTIGSITGLITLLLFLSLNTLPELALAVPKAPEPDRAGKARIVENYGKLPLSFEKNQGQTDEKVGFLSRGRGYTLFLAPDEAVLALSSPSKDEGLGDKQKDTSQVLLPEKQKSAKDAVIRMKFSGANTAPVISGEERLPGTSNYFIGNDPSKWRTRISKYSKVRYREVYPGIDLVFYGNQRQLEYDFVVSPGSDPSKIRLEFQGVEDVSLDEKGNLVLRLKDGEVIQHAPVIYQKVNGRRVNVTGGYQIDNKGRVGCKVASWDRQRPLVIDPVLVYSTYIGGNSDDQSLAIAVDGSGNAYVTGDTLSSDFPTVNALYPNLWGDSDAFIFKLSADGSQAVYSTYLGGIDTDYGNAIAVDSSGNAYVTGDTSSSDFPTVNALYPNLWGDSDAFIFKLSADGSQAVYSTYLGGSNRDWGYGIAVDDSGNAHVTGRTWSSDFPTVNALYPNFWGYNEAFIFKLSADGSQAVYSTYLRGSGGEFGSAIAVDGSGNAYVTGPTTSSDFPTVNALYPTYGGGYSDAFIFKLSADGGHAVYSTYLGGSSGDYGYGIAVDASGNAYVTGTTYSSDFPTVNALYPNHSGGDQDAFIFKLSADGGHAVYSTYLGGNDWDYGSAIAVDGSGNAYVTGPTTSSDFPTVNALYPTYGGGYSDAFIFKLSADGGHAVYSTYLGGNGSDWSLDIAVDGSGNAYVTGETGSSDFPTVNALYSDRGGVDAFIAKISDNIVPGYLDHFSFSAISSPQTIGTPFQVTIIVRDQYGDVFPFNGDVFLSSSIGNIAPLTANLSNGLWTGDVTLYEAGIGIYLSATSGVITGNSNSFEVTDIFVFFVDLFANPTSGLPPLNVQFTIEASHPQAKLSYVSLSFGDGETWKNLISCEDFYKTLSHTYSDTGNYIATLTVTDENGEEAIDTVSIEVTDTSGESGEVDMGDIFTLAADHIEWIDSTTFRASGNVSLNELICFEGIVEGDKQALTLEGEGEVYINDVAGFGRVYIFEDGFYFNLSDIISAYIAEQSKILGLPITIDELAPVWDGSDLDGISVSGTMNFPEDLGGGSIAVEGLEITKSAGITLAGGRIDLPDVDFKVATLKSAYVQFDSSTCTWAGGGNLEFATWGIGCNIEFSDGMLYGVAFSFAYQVPVICVPGGVCPGGAPIVYFQAAVASVENIPEPENIVVTGGVHLTAGPEINGFYLIGMDDIDVTQGEYGTSITIDLAQRASVQGDLILGGFYEIASAEGYVDWSILEFGASGEIDFLGMLIAEADLTITPDNPFNLEGSASGELCCPTEIPWIGGECFSSVEVEITEEYVMGKVTYGFIPITFIFDWEGRICVGPALDLLICWPPSSQLAQSMMAKSNGNFIIEVPEGLPHALIRMPWGEGNVRDFNLYSPSNERITPEVAQANPEKYVYVESAPDSWYGIKNPESGQWQVEIPGNAGSAPTPEFYAGNVIPTLTLTAPITEQNLHTGNNVQISWTDDDPDNNAVIGIYYDRDNQGVDGTPIVTDIQEDNETDTYTWQIPDSLPTGTYYIYITIFDGKNVPVNVYSPAIHITNPEAPAAPTGLTISERTLSWNKVSAASVYPIYYTQNQASGYKYLSAVGDTNQWIIPGRFSGTHFFAVSAINQQGLEGPKSDPIEVTLSAVPDIEISSKVLKMGFCPLGESAQKSIQVKNTGKSALALGVVLSGSSDFDIVNAPSEVSPSEQKQILIGFSPSEKGLKTATLFLSSNDPDEQETKAIITGIGYLPGDANGDGSTNVQDVICIINVILDTGTASGNPDCNDDGNVNVLDVICVINKILGV